MNHPVTRLGTVVLLVMLVGCEPESVTTAPRQSQARSDASLIALVTQERGEKTQWIAVVPAVGGKATRLHEGSEPAWSPNGERLAFTCYPGICTMNPDGTNVDRLTKPPDGAVDEEPAWGPNGNIAFTRNYMDGKRTRDIFIIRTRGGRPIPLITKGSNFSPAWAPDGLTLAFIRRLGPQLEAPPGGFQLWRMSSSGSNVRQLTTTGAWRPDWSRDGTSIVFDAGEAIWTILPERRPSNETGTRNHR